MTEIRLIEPENGARAVPLLSPRLRQILAEMPEDGRWDRAAWYETVAASPDAYAPQAVRFRFAASGTACTLLLGTSPELSDARRICIAAGEDGCTVENLEIGTRYYWRVESSDGAVSPTWHFATEARFPRLLFAPQSAPVRDLGGYSTKNDAFVRQGVLLCAGDPSAATVAALGIRTVLRLSPGTQTAFPAYADVFTEDGMRTCREMFSFLAQENLYPLCLDENEQPESVSTLLFLLYGALGFRTADALSAFSLRALYDAAAPDPEEEPFASFYTRLREFGGDTFTDQCRAFLARAGVTADTMRRLRQILLVRRAPSIHLLSPSDGARDLPLLHPALRECILRGERKPDGRLNIDALKKDGIDESQPQPVSFRWECDGAAQDYLLYIGTRPDGADARRYTAGATGIDLYNLIPGETYFWSVTVCGEISESTPLRSFTTEALLPRTIRAPRAGNIRDLGGRTGIGGRKIRFGKLFRGSWIELEGALTDEGCRVLRDDLGIRTEIDLRLEALERLRCSPLGGDRVQYLFLPIDGYGNSLIEEARPMMREIFHTLADPAAYPIYFHCQAGADRTGTIAFLTQALLGVSMQELLEDYELTSVSTYGERNPEASYVQYFLSVIRQHPGESTAEKVRACLLEIGIPAEELDAIGRILLEETT